MDLSPFGYDRRREAVVILGAGATRGASFADAPYYVKPPLDGDFFAQLRASDEGQNNDGTKLLEFVVSEFGDTDVSMEGFYSQVHLHDQFVADLPKGKGRRRSYEWARKRFLRIIPGLFDETIGADTCSWHEELVRNLDAPDVLISFNYDCLIDAALRDAGRRKWDPASGYAVSARGALDAWRDHTGTGRFPNQGLRLLKLHGSLNWGRAANGALALLEDAYVRRADGELRIIPPLWHKTFEEPPFHDIWIAARNALNATKALLLIGYSLPTTDVYTQAMLRIDVQGLDFLLIANPDHVARARIRRVLRSAITTNTRVVEVESLADVGRLLQNATAAETGAAPATVSLPDPWRTALATLREGTSPAGSIQITPSGTLRLTTPSDPQP